MKKNDFAFILAALVLLVVVCGSVWTTATTEEAKMQTLQEIPQETQPQETVPEYTSPADSGEADVTCLGSYTTDLSPDAVAARLEEKDLTNEQLRAWYYLTAAQYRLSGAQPQPDWSIPLDAQPCPADNSLNSWQQYFLRSALESWHSAQALALQAEQEGVPLEEAYKPHKMYHEQNLQDIPATRFLYGYYDHYVPNTMHQAYLDSIPEVLEDLARELGFDSAQSMAAEAAGTDLASLTEAATLYNYAYMYLTTLSYDLTPTAEAVQEALGEQAGNGETYVNFRQILLVPGDSVSGDGTVNASEEAWDAALEEAQKLQNSWNGKEADFVDLAYRNSQDRSSALSGGAYIRVKRGQLLPVLEQWCFDPARNPGDTEILRSEYGLHFVYFSGSETIAQAQAREELTAGMHSDLITAAREKYPMEVFYEDISLVQAEALLSLDAVLYPDVAHERFPEVPLYLQQDYPNTMYGYYPVATHGCGITSMAMLASYQTDDELTVPEMCQRFGNYCLSSGTNHMIFQNEPAGMGFFLRQFTTNANEAKAALHEGYIVVSLQHKGYWTMGGHFIVMEAITEDDMVQVRDSNLYNFGRLEAHKQDLHTWSCITPQSAGYWIFEKKVTSTPACVRCGQPETTVASSIVQDYCCDKCRTALLRRENWLSCIQ